MNGPGTGGQNGEAGSPWAGRSVAITGVCGTVGRELLAQVLKLGVGEVLGLDNNESELFLLARRYDGDPRVRFSLADVRDADSLARKFCGVQVVLHAAAFKHVPLCEDSPRDAVKTNILGTQNVIDAAVHNRCERVVFTSSDKAVNPTSVMGTSKLMGERLMTAADAGRRGAGPVFASTRFGNVLGSRGSVIPLFRAQIAAGGPVTVTHRKMTRFIMTLQEATRLVLDSVFLARGGEVFVTKMPVVRIPDLARVMVDELAPVFGHDPADVEVLEVGPRPGEKMFEELLNEEEVRRTVELARYYVVTPALHPREEPPASAYPDVVRTEIEAPFNSANTEPMSVAELRDYLRRTGLLEGEAS